MTDRARNRCFVVQGPEPLSFDSAARRLAAAWPGSLGGPLKVSSIPAWIVASMAPLVADARYLLDLLRVTFETNTAFEAWDDLGTPTMTVEDYARYIDETGDVPRK